MGVIRGLHTTLFPLKFFFKRKDNETQQTQKEKEERKKLQRCLFDIFVDVSFQNEY